MNRELFNKLKKSNQINYLFEEIENLSDKINTIEKDMEKFLEFKGSNEYKDFIKNFDDFYAKFNKMEFILIELLEGMKEDGTLPTRITRGGKPKKKKEGG